MLDNTVAETRPPTTATKEGSEEWLPMGVWALTQEQKGDAVMFFQLSISKQGVISGAYKNTLTGGSEQIIGSGDCESQLAPLAVGQNCQTGIETRALDPD